MLGHAPESPETVDHRSTQGQRAGFMDRYKIRSLLDPYLLGYRLIWLQAMELISPQTQSYLPACLGAPSFDSVPLSSLLMFPRCRYTSSALMANKAIKMRLSTYQAVRSPNK